MKRTIRLPIVVVLSLALALSAVGPAVTLAQEGTSPACAAAYAALARYYGGEITKAEADAAVALCEAESQDPPGNGQGGGPTPGDGQGGGGQGQIPQNHDESGAPTGPSPGSSGQGRGPLGPEPNENAVAVTGDEYYEEYRKHQPYCGDRIRPPSTNGMSSGHDPRWPGQYVTWRCDGNQWQAISYREVYTPPATPPDHIAREWVEALLRAGIDLDELDPPQASDICVGGWSHTIDGELHVVRWEGSSVSRSVRFPFLTRYPHWEGVTIRVRNPDYDHDACQARRLAEARAAALEQRRLEWARDGVPPRSCAVRTFFPPVPNPNVDEEAKRTRYYVVHVVPDSATGELNERTLVDYTGGALDFNGYFRGSVWGAKVAEDRGVVMREMGKFDCTSNSHNDVVPAAMITPPG